ncbi:Oxygen-independent coproporphyrinogen-III oxidase-like protein YqeR [Aliiroseovarius pelagivivens]|uniref:Heme chaperone HemW n=1 Tax=Aliiroseovarius pelagivivens TaxID=1639690 RepID=A0A2R8ASM0_9RHOB|nr:radical SAM family heme chaperone HemW [Aliiroseovarius pelagivivens]SPF79051.1 Oxygen-independent coproporphyrinogen-III oxidase-like protein YqeR [Aliiroseovarius pelagivivens]
MPENWQIGGFGLYVHWPFCASKCPYCDFNSHVATTIDQSAWLEAYLAELRRVGAETEGRVLDSIYFGGGTPSLMAPETVAAIIDEAKQHWTFANDIEITLEANPSSIEAQNFAGYRDGGVNRVSMGIQALNNDDLRKLGRLHSVDEAKQALTLAKSLFSRVNFDLIYARQDQSIEAWDEELREALSFEPSHLSMYQLTIEPGTAFGARHEAGKLLGLPLDEQATEMFFLTQRITRDAGIPAYEVSNHARPGDESRHNLIYWRSGDWLGIGPGAHGRITLNGTRYATETALAPNEWLKTVSQGSGESLRDVIPADEWAAEFLLMGLRTAEGIDLARLNKIHENPINVNKFKDLIELDLIDLDGNTLRATENGRPVLNGILRELLPD